MTIHEFHDTSYCLQRFSVVRGFVHRQYKTPLKYWSFIFYQNCSKATRDGWRDAEETCSDWSRLGGRPQNVRDSNAPWRHSSHCALIHLLYNDHKIKNCKELMIFCRCRRVVVVNRKHQKVLIFFEKKLNNL